MADRGAKLDFILRLVDQVTAPAANIARQLQDVAEVGKNGFVQMGAGMAGVVGTIVAFKEGLQPARDQLRALGEVRSLGVAEDALDSLQAKSFEFAVAYGENATAFVQSAYSIEGAVKDLTGSQLALFTNASNVLAKATKTDSETISAYIGTLYGLNKAQADAMGKGEWVEMLAGQSALAVQLFRTSGQQLNDAFKATGIGASAAGVSLAEQMAVLGTLGTTLEGGEAGGLYKSFFENIAGASEKLGMKFTDSNGRLLPMLSILDKLKGKFGDLDTQAKLDAITGAFGGEASRLIVTLMKDTDRLRGGLDKLGKVKGMEQAEQMAKAMVDPFDQFAAMLQNLRIVMGQVLMPVLTPLIQRITKMGTTFQRWLTMFPNIARWLGYITLGLLALVAAAGLLTVLGGVMSVLSILISPIALLVLGIVLLIVAVGAAIIWWDQLKAKFGNSAWFQALLTIISPVVLAFKIWVAVLQLGWAALQKLWSIGANVVGWLAELTGATSGANSVWDTLLWAFTNLSPFALLGKALKGLIELLNKIPGVSIDTSFAELPKVPEVPEATQMIRSVETLESPTAPIVPEVPTVARFAEPAGAEQAIATVDQANAAQKAQQTIRAAIPSLSPSRPASVPPGGLLTSIQNTTTQNKGTHVEKVEIHTGKAMTSLELENMLGMAAG
ncbi:phage tail tape measure protein [Pseudomonas sp. 1D4]|uniref:phage tail tape measure protein n=1 Tax=Pseudomonas sp. 1D4 TaxID=1843691 RepID=UPI00084B86E9|nr:phage tail tape measure protein [Pseudomonas sp. 1D4]OEC43899.1 phage tail tape measure protein [Pseudomonas sp. 1D4]